MWLSRFAKSIGLLASALAVAQELPSFEVASIREHKGEFPKIGITTSGPRLTANDWVGDLVRYAFQLKDYELIGESSSKVFDTIYDVAAKAEGSGEPSPQQFRQMMQRLLEERFKIKLHRESREMQVYELVVDGKGLKMKKAAPDAIAEQHLAAHGRNLEVANAKATMDYLAGAIGMSRIGRPVLNKTGLTDAYDLKLVFTPDTPANRRAPDASDISVFSAVQQLGLKLRAAKAAINVMVVDHIEAPSEN
jgi:uncharacterized protein (TIGR03435 family)